MSKVVIPLSGGMDSAVLLYMAAAQGWDEIHLLVFDYDQRHYREVDCAEQLYLAAIKRFPKTKFVLKLVDMRFIRKLAPTSSLTNDDIDTPNINMVAGEAQPKSYVPFRNLIFLSTALSRAEAIGATEVWHGATAVDSLAGYWDASPEFLPLLNNLCDLNREHRIAVMTPLITCNKVDIVKKGVDLGVPFYHTYTCYSGAEIADASTPSSSLRIQGFIGAGYKDPIQYKQQAKLEAIYAARGCKDIPYQA